MNAKIALLLLLGFSFLVMGCGKQAEPTAPAGIGPSAPPAEEGAAPEEEVAVEEGEEALPGEEPEAEGGPESGEEPEAGTEIGEESLAGLFEVETDKPLEDEGLQEDGTPAAQEQD